MIQVLELQDREFKITLTEMLSALIEKVENAQEQMRNVSINMEMLRVC